MKIVWYGQGCFQIILKGKGQSTIIVINPFDSKVKLGAPWKKADILLVTQEAERAEDIKKGQKEPFLIRGPGEYEIKGVFIQGIVVSCQANKGREGKKNTIFVIRAEGVRFCYLGDFSGGELEPKQLDKIGNVDILTVPVKGVPAINTKQALKIISQIEPRIVLPTHYQAPGTKRKQGALYEFLKAF